MTKKSIFWDDDLMDDSGLFDNTGIEVDSHLLGGADSHVEVQSPEANEARQRLQEHVQDQVFDEMSTSRRVQEQLGD